MKKKLSKKTIISVCVFLAIFAFGFYFGDSHGRADALSFKIIAKKHEVADIDTGSILSVIGSFALGSTILVKTKFRKIKF